MKLRDKLIEETILVPMQATSKESANKELLAHPISIDILSATVQLFTNIKEQENIFTASADRGIAYPHSTSVEVNELTCVLGISKKGIDYNSTLKVNSILNNQTLKECETIKNKGVTN